jgi:chaperone LolA
MSRFLLALLFVLPQSLRPDEFVNRVSDIYGRMENFQADFVQISQDFSNRPSRDRGHVYLKRGRKARFDYKEPEERIEYFDGKIFTKYVPIISQARQHPISDEDDERLKIFQIVGNRESPWKDQFGRIETLGGSPLVEGDQIVRLVPKNNKDVHAVVMEADPRSFFIHRLVFEYADGQRNEFRFTNIQTTPLDNSVFTFTPPPGVQLVREN